MKKQHQRSAYTVKDYYPKNRSPIVCLCFSCPGQEELIHNEVCYRCGETGKNLNYLLSELNKEKGMEDIFTSANKEDYIIINASKKVHFEELDGKSQAIDSEIKDTKNLERIEHCIENHSISFIVLFGEKARLLKKTIESAAPGRICIISDSIPHLSQRGLSSIKLDDTNNEVKSNETDGKTCEEETDNTKKRLQIVKERIIQQIVAFKKQHTN